MIETLYPLKFPPGIYHNGTKTQSTGRWYDGNLVRFYQGTIQPVGGWTQRTTTGATITGVPNAAIGVLRNDDSKYLVIGTSHGLFVCSDTNVVSDITPPILVGQTTLDWQLETFGQLLVACVSPFINTTNNNLYKWDGNPDAWATLVIDAADGLDVDTINYFRAPSKVKGILATPERFLFVLQHADPAVGLSTGNTTTLEYRANRAGLINADTGEPLDIGPLIIN